MRALMLAALLSAMPLWHACGEDSDLDSPSACVVPDSPAPGVDTGTGLITWDAVPGAASYNFYLQAVDSCDVLDTSDAIRRLSAADLRTRGV